MDGQMTCFLVQSFFLSYTLILDTLALFLLNYLFRDPDTIGDSTIMSDSSMLPQRAPPPGVTSNLINPVSTGYQQTTCNILCLVFVTLFVTARIYTRIRLVKCVSWDDYLIILATIVFYSDVGCFQYIVTVGLGRHLWDVSAERFSPHFLETWTFAAMIYSVCMLLTKMSILMLYRRLFPIENFRYLWWMCVFCTVGYGLGAIFSSLFACVPVRAQWDLTVPTSRCINKQAFYIGNGVMNIITDLMILALPIPIVWRLTLELRQKIILSVVFTLGSISCVISLVRLLSIVTWIRVGDGDITYTLQPIVAWSEIELAACILCACIPCLRPFFTTHLPFLSLSAHTSASSNDKTNPAGGNNNFPTTIGGKRSRAISPYPYDDTEGIFDGTQDIELENYDIEMQKNIPSMPATPSVPYTPDTPHTATHAKKLSYAKHGYKPSTGNITVVSVQAMGSRSASRSVSRKSSFSRSSFEENGAGKSVSRQQSLRSIGEERRGRSQRGRGNEDEGGIVVQTSYHVQSVREDV